jgi:hypothetical protein
VAEESKKRERPAAAAETPGPARLYALLAGAFLALLGVLGFFYDAEFGTGSSLASDDLSGLLNINGWRNVIYIATGLVSLAFAARFPRRTAFGIGLFYLVFSIWGFDQTDRDIGSLLDAVPLGDKDNALHLILGILGVGAALVDGPLPKVPEKLKPKRKIGPKNLKPKAPKLRKGKSEGSDEAPKNEKKSETKTEKGTLRGGSGSRPRGRAAPPRAGDA